MRFAVVEVLKKFWKDHFSQNQSRKLVIENLGYPTREKRVNCSRFMKQRLNITPNTVDSERVAALYSRELDMIDSLSKGLLPSLVSYSMAIVMFLTHCVNSIDSDLSFQTTFSIPFVLYEFTFLNFTIASF